MIWPGAATPLDQTSVPHHRLPATITMAGSALISDANSAALIIALDAIL